MALRSALESSLLERSGLEEQLHTDLLLGDATFETSYNLPGEVTPPRVRIDLTVEWSTWSQSAFRSWTIGEGPDEPVEIVCEASLRFSSLAASAGDPKVLQKSLPSNSPTICDAQFELRTLTVEDSVEMPTGEIEHAAEATYEATFTLDEGVFSELSSYFDSLAGGVTAWLSSLLVHASDIPLSYHQL